MRSDVLRLALYAGCAWLAAFSPCEAAWGAWQNSLAPRGEPGRKLTLTRAGRAEYVIVMPEKITPQERKAAEELSKWLEEMTGAKFPLRGLPVILNGDFEESSPWRDGSFPFGWEAPPEGYRSPARAQSGVHAIGGAGTSAYMYIDGRNGMRQSGLNVPSAVWTLEMDFASEDPPAERDACSMYVTIEITGGGGITFTIKDMSDNGKGELYFRDGKGGDKRSLVFNDAIVFDDDVQETPLVHHLRIAAHFDVEEPYYDVFLTDPNGRTHRAMGVKNFAKPVQRGASPTLISTYTAWNAADHLLDNVRISVPGDKQSKAPDPKARADKFISIGRTSQLAAANLPQAAEDLGEEGYAIVQKGNNLFLFGGSKRGPIYAVMALLEEDLGCRWYTGAVSQTFGNVNRIPRRPTLAFRPVTRTYVPQFELREPHYQEAYDGIWSLRNRTNGQQPAVAEHWGGHNSYAIRVHTFNTLVPRSKYFAEHPEYFMLNLDGQRVSRQLCPSNPDVIRIATESMRKALRENPDAEYTAISANDGNWRCHCLRCRALDKAADPGKHCHHCFITHYSSAGSLLHLTNRIAEALEGEFPDVLFVAQAYLSSLRAAVRAKVRPNVAIELCNHTQLLNRPEDWTTSQTKDAMDYREQFEKWSRLTRNLHIWEYTANYARIMMLSPNMQQIAAATRMYADRGVKGLMFQGNHGNTRCAERALMRVWVMAKLLWDPSRDVGQLQQDFVWGFYGKAAPAISKYYGLLKDLGAGKFKEPHDRSEGVPGLEGGPAPWAKAFAKRADEIFDRAERLAENDTIRARVALERASVMYLKLERGPKFVAELGQDYGALIDRFEKTMRRQKISRLGYRDTLDGKLTRWRNQWKSRRAKAM